MTELSTSNFYVFDHPVIQDRVRKLRDKNTTTRVFQSCLRDLGMLMTYNVLGEVLNNKWLVNTKVETPLATCPALKIDHQQIKFISILRAGLGLLDGARLLLPEAAVGHIGIFRSEDTHSPNQYYCNLPAIKDSDLVVLFDPMIATGGSSEAALEQTYQHGAKHIVLIATITAQRGIDRLLNKFPTLKIFTSAHDQILDANDYIVPGLGDAGDRLFNSSEPQTVSVT